MRFAGSNPKLASFMGDSPKYGDIGDIGLQARSSNKQKTYEAEGQVASAGLDAMGQIKAAKHRARGIEATGMAQAAATRASGFSNMMGGIAGGIGNMSFGKFNYAGGPGSAGTKMGAGGGNVGGYGTLGPNYGIWQG